MYVVPTQVLWITANSQNLIVFDPRSGVNVSEFTGTGAEQHGNGTFIFRQLAFIPESNEVVGTTSRRSLITWKYNPTAPCTILPGHADIVESLCYSNSFLCLIKSFARAYINF